MARKGLFRKTVQAFWAAATNSYLPGYFQGKIYQGALKRACLPGLNCYSCPGSIGSCPIGSLQAVLASPRYIVPFWIAGYLLMVGGLAARLVCGFFCPFGLVQEALYRIPFPVKARTFRFDRALRKAKYAILAAFVLAVPQIASDSAGNGVPFFCKWLCPAGTLEAALPLMASSHDLRNLAGFVFLWKALVLAAVAIACLAVYRAFCRYLCPLGAIYGFFNRFSAYRYAVEEIRCTSCGACEHACPMAVNPRVEANSAECIRCGACKAACARGAIYSAFLFWPLSKRAASHSLKPQARQEAKLPSREQTAAERIRSR
ncbi:MAG: 4Fe-4S binding protein [Eubacteriaceae bacterium]|nr:4Fe-4S binding protein [Eubacteriaceae bacterium]